jgi:hypothetical protein
MLAGIPIRDEAVLELARLVDDEGLAQRLEDAYRLQVKILALEISDRDSIISALVDAPAGLEELRGCSPTREGLEGSGGIDVMRDFFGRYAWGVAF